MAPMLRVQVNEGAKGPSDCLEGPLIENERGTLEVLLGLIRCEDLHALFLEGAELRDLQSGREILSFRSSPEEEMYACDGRHHSVTLPAPLLLEGHRVRDRGGLDEEGFCALDLPITGSGLSHSCEELTTLPRVDPARLIQGEVHVIGCQAGACHNRLGTGSIAAVRADGKGCSRLETQLE